MTCPGCQKDFPDTEPRCPHCRRKNDEESGLFQTSTVLISAEGADQVFRSVDDVPPRLRSRLLKSTNSTNSATILIADRRGREEIKRTLRRLPGSSQKRLVNAILGAPPQPDPLGWLTPARRKWLAGIVVLLALALVAAVFLYHVK